MHCLHYLMTEYPVREISRRLMMQYLTDLESTINDMVQKGRGILAADESTPTIAKRFKAKHFFAYFKPLVR